MKAFWFILIAFALGMPSFSFGQKDDMFTKEWSDSNRLKIIDFTGYPPPYRNEVIYPFQHIDDDIIIDESQSNYTMKIVIRLEKIWSWIKPNDTTEARAQLPYIQDMFDLLEVYARMMRRDLQIKTFSYDTFYAEREKIIDGYEAQVDKAFISIEQEEHDKGTKIYSNLEQYINTQLDSLKAYKNPIFKITFK